MQSKSREKVRAVLEQHAERRSLQELAAAGERHVRVVSGDDFMRLIESIVAEAIEDERGDVDADRHERIVAETKQRLAAISAEQSEAEAAVREHKEALRQARRALKALARRERSAREENERLRASLTERPDGDALADLEARFGSLLERTVDEIGRTVRAAAAGPVDDRIEATDALLAKIFDDEAAMDSNGRVLPVDERRAGDVSGSIERLRALRRSGA